MCRFRIALGLAFLLAGCAGRARQVAVPAAASSSGASAAGTGEATAAEPPLPVDPAVRLGTLPNGLRYYVRAHEEPRQRASLRLVVNAGSVLESDRELGFAHYVEHMAFNGTRLLPKHEIVDFIERVGMRFGHDANASTSFDETIYMFEVPTGDPAVLGKAFLVLSQIAGDASFDPEEVERERGVIIEEWRLGRGAGARIMEKVLPAIFRGSRYAERLPIGRKEILERATAEGLLAFYRRWYRPDLMAVIAVGDFDPGLVAGHIEQHFGPMRAPAVRGERPRFPVPDHEETLVAVGKDREMPGTSVGVIYKVPRRAIDSRRAYRRHVVEAMYHRMINGRLEEQTRIADPPFLFAGSTSQPFVQAIDVFLQVAVVKQDGLQRGLLALTRETERVDRHGFAPGELEREKVELLRELERAVKEKDKVPSATYSEEMIRNFLRQEAMPGIDRELELTREFLPTVTLQEMNRVASEWISERNRVILVQSPEAAPVPPDRELRALFDKVQKEEIPPYVDKVAEGPLIGTLPRPGKVRKERQIDEVGVTEWQLANGVRVVVKSTDFRNDQVLLQGFSPGGHSRAPDRDYHSALYAADLVSASGVGRFGPTELRKALAGKAVNVTPYIEELEEGVSGHASPDDLETMLQLVHLTITAPRRDEAVFAAAREQLREQISQRRADPDTVFWDRWQVELYRNHPRRRPPDPSVLNGFSLDTALRVYKERFADTSDFTFVFVGRVDPARLKPLAEQYLGSLPSRRRKESWRDVGARPVDGARRFEVAVGVEPKSNVALIHTGAQRWSREEEQRLDTVTEALALRLREVLREELGGTYGVEVTGELDRRPAPFYRTDVRFTCAPENVDRLLDAVNAEMRSAQQQGFPPDMLVNVKLAQQRALEVAVRNNGYWLGRLSEHYRFGTDPRLVLEEPRLIESVDAPSLRAAALKYFDGKRRLLGIQRPAAAAAAAPQPAAGGR
jgi:zinc protease